MCQRRRVNVDTLNTLGAVASITKTAAQLQQDAPVLDKDGFARRWLFSRRYIDSFLAQGLPHCKLGSRRVRIVTSEGDRWMIERFGTRRRSNPKVRQHSTQKREATQ
jgi:hypothetical protein